MAYLAHLSEEERLKCLDGLFSKNIPCLIVSRHHDVFKEIVTCSKRYQIPLLRTDERTSTFMSSLIKHLNVDLAPETTLHGVLVEIYGEGVLMLGESGVGKSGTAMELVKQWSSSNG